jgi:glycosyltransferase involved in cell wall biosynthesis
MLSIIFPVYNECNRLEDCVSRVEAYLSKEFQSVEIIIAEDNSTDGSYDIARRIAASDRNVVLLHNEHRLGRGSSLAAAIRRSRGEYVIYMDVDLATDIGNIRRLVEGLQRGAVVSTGSRLMRDANASRPLARDVASRAYNFLVRLLMGSKLYDHQCGFKGFNRTAVLPLLDLVRDNHWFWDTELLVICQRRGLKVDEFPVTWLHNGGNNLNASKVRVLKDAKDMGARLLKLKYRLMTEGLSEPAGLRQNELAAAPASLERK